MFTSLVLFSSISNPAPLIISDVSIRSYLLLYFIVSNAHLYALCSSEIYLTKLHTLTFSGTTSLLVIQRNPDACASNKTIPNPSKRDGNKKTSNACNYIALF